LALNSRLFITVPEPWAPPSLSTPYKQGESFVAFSRPRNAVLCAVSLASLAIAFPAAAQTGGPPPPDTATADGSFLDRPYSLTIGAGAGYLPSYEGSNDYVVSPVGVAFGKIDGFSFSTRGTSLTVDLIRDPKGADVTFEFGPIVNLRTDRHGRVKDPQVAALGKIGNAVELGAFIGIAKNRLIDPYDSLSARLTYQHDVSSVHRSSLWTPEVQYQTPVSLKTYVLLDAQASHVGAGYARTYFSVTPLGALASGLPVYNARAGWKDFRLSLLLGQVLVGDLRRPRLSLFAGLSYSRELGSARNSPIVAIAGSPNQWLAAGGLAYTF
jgi:outer membrane protein